MTVEITEPRQPGSLVVIDGYLVPNIEVHDNPAGVEIVLDGRFGITITDRGVFADVMFLIANAQAVAAGYSCHGENCELSNPHKVKCTRLDGTPKPTLRIV